MTGASMGGGEVGKGGGGDRGGDSGKISSLVAFLLLTAVTVSLFVTWMTCSDRTDVCSSETAIVTWLTGLTIGLRGDERVLSTGILGLGDAAAAAAPGKGAVGLRVLTLTGDGFL